MSEYKDFQVGQRVKVNAKFGSFRGTGLGTVVVIDPEGTSWPIEVVMDETDIWGAASGPFDPEELDIV